MPVLGYDLLEREPRLAHVDALLEPPPFAVRWVVLLLVALLKVHHRVAEHWLRCFDVPDDVVQVQRIRL